MHILDFKDDKTSRSYNFRNPGQIEGQFVDNFRRKNWNRTKVSSCGSLKNYTFVK